MFSDLTSPILDLVAEYGLIAIFVFLILDAAMLLPLFPGELLLILAIGWYAHDPWTLAIVVLMATAAATLGSFLLYGIARGGGRRFFETHPRLFFMSPERRDKMEKLFQRPAGQSLVLFLRVLPLFRLLVNIPAGLARMPVLRFLILTFIGNLLFHAGFMYVAYESRRPDSAIATQATAIREGYASPAWGYVQANWVLAAAALLGLGLLLSLRASWRATRRPHDRFEGSLLGTLATATLFWGGVALLTGLWVDPALVYDLIAFTGYDLRTIPVEVPYAPLSVAVIFGGCALLMGLLLSAIRQSARSRSKASHRRPLPAPSSGPVGRR